MNFKTTLSAALALGLVVSLSAPAAFAQEEMSAEEIAKKLAPKGKTRSIGVKKREEQKKELDAILGESIGKEEREKIVEITKKAELPSLDFAITFGYDSAKIEPSSFTTLDTLAAALKTEALGQSKFLINGHTDSKGSDDYNLALSQKRANAVSQYLVTQHDIEPARLKAIGFGETALKDELDGEAASNRRVEIVNRP